MGDEAMCLRLLLLLLFLRSTAELLCPLSSLLGTPCATSLGGMLFNKVGVDLPVQNTSVFCLRTVTSATCYCYLPFDLFITRSAIDLHISNSPLPSLLLSLFLSLMRLPTGK
ncbi:hypothetical protein GE09DRAFT_328168 [Coniochaeta sp. 2T2.1]|nr:hypothetical protein GE09DRAFT_328168 [Coniochaeta sp. 2T2.1]